MRLTLLAVFCFATACSARVVRSEPCTTSTATYTHRNTSQLRASPSTLESEPETVAIATVTEIVTQTTTIIQTKTPAIPCPAVSTGVLSFDDLPTRGVSPMPLVYKNFTFISPAWQYYTYTSTPPQTPLYRAIPASSRPNALTAHSEGFLSIGAIDQSFSFDLLSAKIFAFTNDGDGDPLHLQFELVHRDGGVESVWRTTENGFVSGRNSTLVEFGKGDAGRWVDLIEVKLAAWEKFDNATGEGNGAVLVLDDIEHFKRYSGGEVDEGVLFYRLVLNIGNIPKPKTRISPSVATHEENLGQLITEPSSASVREARPATDQKQILTREGAGGREKIRIIYNPPGTYQ
ncbi:unnamed protein product [Tuber aestivum]|uniref:NADH:ubiquinone oxidoreductase intermediate-associated protein 30 domain-containing protein n=1 Tax=Tuber aestivum TaxID=59557 RepID=A0A292PU99_9PEZI|nr:unnamed protein product [Tuber aestivum]